MKRISLFLGIILLLCISLCGAHAETNLTIQDMETQITVEAPDSQELLDGFALRELYGMRGVSTWGRTARESLPEPLKHLYDSLKVEIEKIAIGQRASSEFSFSADALYSMGFNSVFSAEAIQLHTFSRVSVSSTIFVRSKEQYISLQTLSYISSNVISCNKLSSCSFVIMNQIPFRLQSSLFSP